MNFKNYSIMLLRKQQLYLMYVVSNLENHLKKETK